MELTYRRKINSDIKTIYSSLSTPGGVQGWWCKNSSIGSKEGEGHVMNFMKEGKPVVMKFEITELSKDRKVVWTCTDNDNPSWIGTQLVFDIGNNGERVFTHRDFDEKWKGAPPFENTAKGWEHFMDSLKDYCETGQGAPW